MLRVALSDDLFGLAGASGPNPIALVVAAVIAVLIGWRKGHSLESLRAAAVASVGSGIGAIFTQPELFRPNGLRHRGGGLA